MSFTNIYLGPCLNNYAQTKVLKNTYKLYQNEIWDLSCVNNNEVFNTTCNENGTWENIECDKGKRRVKLICSCYYMLLYNV